MIDIADKNIAFKRTSLEIAANIKEIEDITSKIKNNKVTWIYMEQILMLIKEWAPVNILNLLPKYFQSQINEIASQLNSLQCEIWRNLYNPAICRKILEHLLALNIESIHKQTFEGNYKITREAEKREAAFEAAKRKIEIFARIVIIAVFAFFAIRAMYNNSPAKNSSLSDSRFLQFKR